MEAHQWNTAGVLLAGVAIGWYLTRALRRPEIQLGDSRLLELTEADVTRLFRGGLLPAETVTVLSDPFFAPWEELSRRLPQLNRQGRLADAIEALPELCTSRLRTCKDLQRAYVLLGQAVHSWVHGANVPWPENPVLQRRDPAVPRVVPRQIAVPFASVCARLGLPCVLTAAGTDLWNWRMVNPAAYMTMDNLRCLSTMTGLDTEVGFHLVPLCMMHRIEQGGLLVQMLNVPYWLAYQDFHRVVATLRGLAEALGDCRTMFLSMKQHVDINEFYNLYRPLLSGFSPEGVVLEGVGPTGITTVDPNGPSAGQHVIFAAIDLLLSVAQDSQGAAHKFQKDMVGRYMPKQHTDFLHELRCRIEASGTTVRDAAVASGGDLLKVYSACVEALRQFRMHHLGIATRYLANAQVGTGKSSFRDMLTETIAGTASATPT